MTKTKTAKRTSACVRSLLRPDKFVRIEDFPVDCDSKLDECYGHTTEVLRGRIGTRQLIAIARFELDDQTPAPAILKWTPVVSREDDFVDDNTRYQEEQRWGDRYYKYVAGGARAGS